MSAAKQSKTKGRTRAARGKVATSTVRTRGTEQHVALAPAESRKAQPKNTTSSRGAPARPASRKTAKTSTPKVRRTARKHGVGEQIVDYVRTAALRLSELPLARTLERDARRLYDVLVTQERQLDRVVRWQVTRFLTRRAPQRQLGAMKNALQKLDVRRLPVASAR